jgi:hypothetical protein
LSEQPGYADAYDVMARVLLDQGLPDQALSASREALSLTPGSIARLVKHGLLAFFYGDPGEAREALTRAAPFGLNSKTFDLQGLVLLAMMQFDKGDARATLSPRVLPCTSTAPTRHAPADPGCPVYVR